MKYRAFALLGIVALFVASCTSGTTDGTFRASGVDDTSTISTNENTGTGNASAKEDPDMKKAPLVSLPLSVSRQYGGDSVPSELSGLITLAVVDAASRFAVEAQEVAVVSVEEVVWPNGAVGCPRPGMSYSQVAIDGLRIVVEVSGVEYAYHSGGRVDPFLCEHGVTSSSSGEPDDPMETSTDSTLVLEKTAPLDDSEPTEEPGGPGGEPDS
jgi:hypothetical protein